MDLMEKDNGPVTLKNVKTFNKLKEVTIADA